MSWVEYVQLLPGIAVVVSLAGYVLRRMQRRHEKYLERKITEIHGNSAVARRQLEPNGGADRPDPSTYDLALGTYRQLQNHIGTPNAHQRSGGD